MEKTKMYVLVAACAVLVAGCSATKEPLPAPVPPATPVVEKEAPAPFPDTADTGSGVTETETESGSATKPSTGREVPMVSGGSGVTLGAGGTTGDAEIDATIKELDALFSDIAGEGDKR